MRYLGIPRAGVYVLTKEAEVLADAPLFKGLKSMGILNLLGCIQAKTVHYKKNDIIVSRGDTFQAAGMLVSGKVVIGKESEEGERLIIAQLEPGDLFGEVLAFSDQTKWFVTVEAKEDCEVLFLPKEKIIPNCFSLCRHHQTMIGNLLHILSEKALLLNRKIDYLSIKSISGRFSAFLWDQYQRHHNDRFTLPMNRRELAEFLKVSRPSLSREISKMKTDGIIDYHQDTFVILDMERLKENRD
jgi:CRP-like cAMP-binding protein